jgi:hypothetical protein
MNPGYLILHPTPSSPPITHVELVARLTEIHFLGMPVTHGKEQFYPGDHFLQWITYLGCSPAIPLDHSDPQLNCTIQLFGPYEVPQLISGSNTRPPRCPHCRYDFMDWQTQFNKATLYPIICPGCGKPLLSHELNWRQQGGIGRQFLAISHVFPGEAVPVSDLFRVMKIEGGEWEYCYTQDPIRLESLPKVDADSE